MREYEYVRVVRILRSPEEYDGWRLNQRPPEVGEVGALIDVLRAPGLPDRYVVEHVAPDGSLADFLDEELELAPPESAT